MWKCPLAARAGIERRLGGPDREIDDVHVGVGLLVVDHDGGPAWRCTGTLLTPTIMLTAGHCAFGAEAGRVRFDTEVTDAAYPLGGGTRGPCS